MFNAILGSETVLDIAFDRTYWLGITINSGSELTPRIEMTSSAYSLKAAGVADSSITAGNIADGQVVKSINSLKDDIWLMAGSNISNTPDNNSLSIAADLSGTGNTLDQAYDQGGPGAGRTIFADAGAFVITGVDGVVFGGSYNSGTIPQEGAGTRMMWYPRKAAFRAGRVDGTYWDDSNIGVYSVAMGNETMASGGSSMAMGFLSTASGSGSIAMGHQTTASGSNSTAMGSGSMAIGENSSAIGEATLASGYSSIALGLHSTASGPYSTAIGGYTTSDDYYSTALGCSTMASGSNSTAMGLQTTASGVGSTSMGNQTTASGGNSLAVGLQTSASGDQSTAIGFLSTARSMSSMAIGSLAKANHMCSIVIAANLPGNEVDSISSGGIEQMVIRADGGMYITNTSGQAPFESDKLINTSSGAYLTTGGAWTDASDRNLKENFTSVNTAELLTKLKTLEISNWNYKSENPNIKHIGPVAQDFYAAFGVGNDDKSISTIDPAGIALATIQELEKRTSYLQMENQSLKEKIALLEQNLKKLEELLNR